MKTRSTSTFAVLALLAAASASQAAILGDIAIVRFQTTNPDSFSFVALRALAANDAINFTDNGWLAAGGFRGSPNPTEGSGTFTAPAGGVAAGTVITVTNVLNGSNPTTTWTPSLGSFTGATSNFSFSNGGDQLFAYTGTLASPTFLYGVTTNRSTWDENATTANTSALPSALSGANVALGATSANTVDAVYAGPTTGTAAALLTNINNTANWTKGTFNAASNPLTAPSSFTITAAATAALSTTAVGTDRGTATVNGSNGNFVIANVATNAVTSGSVTITGGITSSANPILVYLDRNVDTDTFPTISGVTFDTSKTYNFGTGVTYDTLVTYSGRPTGTGDFFFNFSGLPAINNIAVVPEPAAFAVLAPAGLLLARRRRA